MIPFIKFHLKHFIQKISFKRFKEILEISFKEISFKEIDLKDFP